MNTATAIHGKITRLYPAPGQVTNLPGLYLEHRLHEHGSAGKPCIFSNFITTLDGRIAIAADGRNSHEVPRDVANARDWRLYQELAAQADLLITSGRFLRQTAAGEAQDALPVSTQPAFADLHDWRQQQGLAPQPDIAVLSSSLELPLTAFDNYRDRRVLVITGTDVPRGKIRSLTDHGIEVITAGSGLAVDGKILAAELGKRDYRSIYAIAGPAVFSTLVAANILDRLYLTVTHQLLSGDAYDTMTRGPLLAPAYGMKMTGLYHDTHAPDGIGQWFCVFEPHTAQSG